MRVIAGERGHIKLLTPEGMDTRPTTDRIKETLFNILQFDIRDCEFLDLFAGSGQIGIEALSRGASKATFVEKDRKAFEILKKNISITSYEDRSNLLKENVFDALRGFKKGSKFDIVFMDPPYAMEQEADILKLLYDYDLLYKSSLVIIEADKNRTLDFVDKDIFTVTRQKIYKTNQHIFIQLRD